MLTQGDLSRIELLIPGMHVGGGRDDLGGAHLLHALQRLLSLGRVQVRMGTLAGHLQ